MFFFMYLCPNGMRDVLSLVPSGYKYIFVYPEGSRDVLSLPLGLNTFSVVVACTFFCAFISFFSKRRAFALCWADPTLSE